MLGSVDKGKFLGSDLSQIYILATGFIEKKKKAPGCYLQMYKENKELIHAGK